MPFGQVVRARARPHRRLEVHLRVADLFAPATVVLIQDLKLQRGET